MTLHHKGKTLPADSTTPKGLTWTMNCVLFGARIIELVKQGKYDDALDEIKGLTGDFDNMQANYLLMRLKDLQDAS